MDIMPSLTQAPVGLDEEEMVEGPELEIVIENPEDVEIGVDGLVIDLMPDDLEGVEFDGNLAEIMDENELASIGSDIIALVDADIQSRKEWVDMYVDGLDVLGMKYERRTEPWDDACGVYSTVLTEAAIRIGNIRVTMSHAPMGYSKGRVSKFSIPEHDSFHLHGHCHSKLGETIRNKQMDVGVDGNKFKPISLSQVESWIAKYDKGE